MVDESKRTSEPQVQPAASGDDGGRKGRVAVGTGDEDGSSPLEIAQDLARKHGHKFVGSQCILFGLIKCHSGKASEILRKLNLSEEEALDEIESHIGEGKGTVESQIPYAPKAKQVLANSESLAKQLNHDCAGSEHMLLAMLQDEGSYAVCLLRKYNIDAQKVEALI